MFFGPIGTLGARGVKLTTRERKMSISAIITYPKDGREYRCQGLLDPDLASIIRKGDEFIPRAGDTLSIWAGQEKFLQLIFNEPTKLPDFMAHLALFEDEDSEEETLGDFERRLSLRDDLAEAFEKAAMKLRAAPRR